MGRGQGVLGTGLVLGRPQDGTRTRSVSNFGDEDWSRTGALDEDELFEVVLRRPRMIRSEDKKHQL